MAGTCRVDGAAGRIAGRLAPRPAVRDEDELPLADAIGPSLSLSMRS
jgi:hypothetical protein